MNVAIVGLGPHGKRFVQCVNAIDKLKLTAVVDRDPVKLGDASIKETTKKLTSLESLWEYPIEVLLIATNGPSHAPIAIEAVKHNVKYILVTKPVATTLADAKKLLSLANKHQVRIAVDHGLRFDDTYTWIRAELKTGKFGDLRSVYIQRPGIGLGCLGVHSFDLANYLSEAQPHAVSGWVDAPLAKNPRGEQFVDPGGLVVLQYRNGVKAIINQIEDGSGPMSVELNCTKARVRVDEKFKVLEYVYKDDARVYRQEINPHGKTVSHDTIQLMTAVINELVFGNSSIVDVGHGVSSFEILLAAYLSNEMQHAPVVIPIENIEAENRFLPVT